MRSTASVDRRPQPLRFDLGSDLVLDFGFGLESDLDLDFGFGCDLDLHQAQVARRAGAALFAVGLFDPEQERMRAGLLVVAAVGGDGGGDGGACVSCAPSRSAPSPSPSAAPASCSPCCRLLERRGKCTT